MCRIFITGDSDECSSGPETFLRPAFFEYLRRAASAPRLTMEWWRELLLAPVGGPALVRRDRRASAGWSRPACSTARQIESFLRDVFTRRGRSNDFRELAAHAVRGRGRARQRRGGALRRRKAGTTCRSRAPCRPAPPCPACIRRWKCAGRHFVDGALRRTMHASLLLERGVDLMIGINPLVPFDSGECAKRTPNGIDSRLSEGGLPVVLSQTFRTLLQSRMQVGLARYAQTVSGHRPARVRAQQRRRRIVLHQRLRLRRAPARVRAGLPQHPCRPARAPRHAGRCWRAHGITLRDEVLDDERARWSAACPRHRRAVPKPPRGCDVRWRMLEHKVATRKARNSRAR